MITTTWTAPSAAALGFRSLDVSLDGLIVAFTAPLPGTGNWFGTPTVVRRRVRQNPVERFIAPTYLPQHDGTTLGIHSSGRPQS